MTEIFHAAVAVECVFAHVAAFNKASNNNNNPTAAPRTPAPKSRAKKRLMSLFDRKRHEQEIERAENIAAGLPPDRSAEGRRSAGQAEASRQQGGQGNKAAKARAKWPSKAARSSVNTVAVANFASHTWKHRLKLKKKNISQSSSKTKLPQASSTASSTPPPKSSSTSIV